MRSAARTKLRAERDQLSDAHARCLVGPTSRLTLPSSYAFRQPPTRSGSERPTHEEAAEAAELNRITVLRKQIDDARREKIRALDIELESLKSATPTRDGEDTPQREEPDISPDENGFPRYKNPVDIGTS